MSTLKSRMKSAVKSQNKPSNAQNATVNRAGGVAFEIQDPALKLVTMTAGAFFAEPKFYDADASLAAKRVSFEQNSSVQNRFQKLEKRLELVSDKLNWLDSTGIDEVTREVLSTAADIALGTNPEDLLIIARWLRNDMNMRTTPQALLILASRMESTKSLVRKYVPTIVLRPDEVKTCLLMHRFFFGMKTLKNGLAQGLSDRMAQFGERALLKYDGVGWPTWKDVLNILPRGNGRPLSKEIATYFLKGEVVNPQATPVIAARKALSKMDDFDTSAQKLAEESQVNWEVLLSQFGTTAAGKKAVWEYLIEKDLLGYMALLRNLRNILQAGVNFKAICKVAKKISDRDEVLASKQLPFRFLSAYRSLTDAGLVKNEADVSELLGAVELASNISAENIKLPGTTAIFVDASGSMTVTVSETSTVKVSEAASMLAGIVAKAADRAYLFKFATDVKAVRFSKTDTVLGIANKFDNNGVNGHNTNAWKIPGELTKLGLVPDRVIVLSDLQAWNDGGSSGYGGYLAKVSEQKAMCDTWADYVAASKEAKKTWLHCVHLNGYGDTPVDKGAHVNQVAGFSEKVFNMLLETEGVAQVDGGVEPVSISTVEQIRLKFKL